MTTSCSDKRSGKPQSMGDALEEMGFPKTGDPLLDADTGPIQPGTFKPIPMPAGEYQPPVGSSEDMRWINRDKEVTDLYWTCFDEVMNGVSKRKLGEFIREAGVVAMTATMYIQRAKARGLS